MRNLREYPITLEEKISVLDKIIEREQERIKKDQIFGSIVPTTLREIKLDVERLAGLED